MKNKTVKNDFSKAPIFYICPVCKNTGFDYIGDISHGEGYTNRRIFRCNSCCIIIAEM